MQANQSLAYRAYVRLLRQLHRLIAEGAGDSAAADDVREAMEAPWSHLTQQEADAAKCGCQPSYTTIRRQAKTRYDH